MTIFRKALSVAAGAVHAAFFWLLYALVSVIVVPAGWLWCQVLKLEVLVKGRRAPRLVAYRDFDFGNRGGVVRSAVDSVFATSEYLSGERYRSVFGLGDDVAYSSRSFPAPYPGHVVETVFRADVAGMFSVVSLFAEGSVRELVVSQVYDAEGKLIDVIGEVAFEGLKRGFVIPGSSSLGTVLRFRAGARNDAGEVQGLRLEHVEGLPEAVFVDALESLKVVS